MCDFGLARHVSSVGSLTGDRGFVGTVDYVAPEQIRGRRRGRTRGPLRTRLCPLRVHRRRASVRARQRARGRLRAPERAAAAADGRQARAADRPRPRHRNRNGEVAATTATGQRASSTVRPDAAIEGAPAPPRARRRSGLLVGAGGLARRTRGCGRARASCSRRGTTRAQTPPQITPASIAGAHPRADEATTTRRCSASAGAKRSSRGRTTRRSATSAARSRIYFESPGRPCGRDHDLEQGLQDGGRNRPVLVDRGSEERLRQRTQAVAREHDRREGRTPTSSGTSSSARTAGRRIRRRT